MAEGDGPIGPATGGPQPPGTERGSDEGLIQTFLFADIRGYTRFSQEHGDEAAGRLAARFADLTTQVIEAREGIVLELAGDGALCIFSTTRRAIRAAIDLQARYLSETSSDPTLPLPVGIGIDTGEAVPVAGGFRGRALNLAARLCGAAKAGEILASREAIHMAGQMDGVHVEDRGVSPFKNITGPVTVMRVTGEGKDAVHWFAEHVAPPVPPKRMSARRRIGIAALVTVLIAVGAITLLDSRGSASTEIAPNSVGMLDPKTGDLVGTLGLGERPGSIAASTDAVWVTHPDAGSVTRIDPSDREVRDSIPVGPNPTGIATGFGAVWVVESGGPSVSRISPGTDDVVDTIAVGNGPAGVAVGEGSVWVTNRFDGTVSRIDPNGGKDPETIPVGLDPEGIAVGFGSVWVGLAGSSKIVRVDPRTDSVTQQIGVGNGPGALVVSADAVWVVNRLDDTIMRIDHDTNSVVGTVPVGKGPSGIAVVGGTVWVANETDGTLSEVSLDETPVKTTVIGSVPQALAPVNGELWVSVNGTATSHRGGTLRLVSLNGPLSLDPAGAYDIISLRVPHLVGDGLLAFEPIGGTSASLEPDLATSIPTPTEGGKTYTFQLRGGIRYSDGEVVAPSDFRRAIERGFPINRSPYKEIYGGIVGAAACWQEPRTCDLSQGIVTDDPSGTITFHLVAPDPDFLNKLTMAFSYPVPPSAPDDEQARAGIAGTGPYMLEAPMTHEGLALVRNPYFRVRAPAAQPGGFADRIEWSFGVEPDAQVEAVSNGDADLAFDTSAASDLGELFIRSAAQVRSSPQALTIFLILNTDAAPFDRAQVRQAMNLALDRDKVVEIFGGEGTGLPTCQQLPPNFPGYEPYCPYTSDPGTERPGAWSGADFKEAKELVRRSGTAGIRVTFDYPPYFWDPQGKVLGDYLVDLLDRLGYVGRVRPLPVNASYAPNYRFQMALDAWANDYPAASNFITNRFTCDGSYVPSAGFCDPKIDAMIDRATRMQVSDPTAAGALWAKVDRAIVDQAPYVWLENPVAVEFISERVRNYRWSLQWGSLLDQLWVR